MMEFVIMRTPDCYIGYIPSMIHICASGNTKEEVYIALYDNMNLWSEMVFEEHIVTILNEFNILLNESDESTTT
jgi:predicted RNase H-like HicB family nuclease